MPQQRYVDGSYAAGNAGWHSQDAPWKAGEIARLLRDEGLRPASVCDVGCGTGGVIHALAGELPGSRLVGYDVSPQAVELAQQEHPGVDVRLGDATALDERFDLVLLVDVFEHVEDCFGFLRSVAPLGERLLCHIPLEMTASVVARGTPLLAARASVGHLHYFTKDTALATLRESGYRVDAWRYTDPSHAPGRRLRSRLAKWPRRIGFRISPDLTVRTLGGYSMLVLATPERAGTSIDGDGA